MPNNLRNAGCVCTTTSCFGIRVVDCPAVDPDDMTRARNITLAAAGGVHYMAIQESAYWEGFLKLSHPLERIFEGQFCVLSQWDEDLLAGLGI